MKKSLGELRESGKKLIGIFIQSASPEMVEIAGFAGFDFVILDNEHSPADTYQTLNLVRAAEAAEVMPLAQIPKIDSVYINKALDTGVAGIIAPNVRTAKEIELAVECSKFSPDGKRGACPCPRSNSYSLSTSDYYDRSNINNSVIALIETADAARNFEEIISVPGVDAVFLGPVDLSVDMGFGGDINNPIVRETLFNLLKRANQKGVFVGIMCMDIESSKLFFDKGADFVVYGVDTMLFYNKCKDVLEKLRD